MVKRFIDPVIIFIFKVNDKNEQKEKKNTKINHNKIISLRQNKQKKNAMRYDIKKRKIN